MSVSSYWKTSMVRLNRRARTWGRTAALFLPGAGGTMETGDGALGSERSVPRAAEDPRGVTSRRWAVLQVNTGGLRSQVSWGFPRLDYNTAQPQCTQTRTSQDHRGPAVIMEQLITRRSHLRSRMTRGGSTAKRQKCSAIWQFYVCFHDTN